MNFVHYLKRAFASRIAYYVVVGVLALFAYAFSGKASAQTCDNTTGYCDYPTQGEAYAGAAAEISSVFPYTVNASLRRIGCTADGGKGILSGNTYNIRYQNQEVPGGATGQCAFHGVGAGNVVHVHRFPGNTQCSTRPALSGGFGVPFDYSQPGTPVAICYKGCEFALPAGQTTVPTYQVDGVTWSLVDGFTPLGSYCVASDAAVPPTDTDGDGVSDALDAFPNDPNETADADGDGVGDNADFSPEDPTDGQDGPGEEDGDDEGDNQASGGGTCGAAPTCSGDGIQCAQLFQMWKLRCQGTAQGNVQGDPQNCSAGITVTSPDPVANAQLLTLRKIACGSGGAPGGSVGDANNNGVADVLEGAGTTADGGDDDEVTRFGLGINPDLLDQDNIFGGGSCPTIPSFPIMGTMVSFSDFPYFCQIMGVARVIILLGGAFLALQILMGRVV